MNLVVEELVDFDLDMLNKLLAFQSQVFGDLGLTEGTLPMFIRWGKVFLLKKEEEIVGSCELMRDWRREKAAFLVGFAIRDGERGQGLGKFFLSEVLDRLASEMSVIRLTVSPQNRAALALYGQFGFKQVESLKDEYGAGEDRLLMEKKS